MTTGIIGCLAWPAAAIAASPAVTTGGASSVTRSSANLNARINPEGRTTTYFFQLGLTTGYGAQTASHSAGAGTRTVAGKAAATRLLSGTVYHYRVVATNSSGTSIGADRHFKTAGPPPAPPAVFTAGTVRRNLHGATLTGVVATVRKAAAYKFQFGTTTAYGLETAAGQLPARPFPQPVGFVLGGLQSHVIYHYRLVASNSDGTAVGADQIFITGRVRARLTRNTRVRHLHGRVYALTTAGRLRPPRGFPAADSCRGAVRVRYLIGRRVRTVTVGVGGDCRYSARAVIATTGSVRLFARFSGNGLLRPAVSRTQLVRVG